MGSEGVAAVSDAGERFYRTVLADVNGTASEAESDSLRDDHDTAREWLAVLTRMVQDTDAAFAKIRADVEARRQASMARGDRGKPDFYAYKAKREQDRAGLLKQKAAIVERMKEARDLIHVFSQDEQHDKNNRFDRMEAKLDKLLRLVEGLR